MIELNLMIGLSFHSIAIELNPMIGLSSCSRAIEQNHMTADLSIRWIKLGSLQCKLIKGLRSFILRSLVVVVLLRRREVTLIMRPEEQLLRRCDVGVYLWLIFPEVDGPEGDGKHPHAEQEGHEEQQNPPKKDYQRYQPLENG
ncbi:hypothetical protein BHM03_00003869 [Ensete ventricosum]|uniref:Uncharacterized protein n=1 Tax=Ensete ventricosum TaxID=4639 RepID=A0A445MA85_ENSVE|nr:hypothetical protein BHM03_00003869 [Ensete ventricosum]